MHKCLRNQKVVTQDININRTEEALDLKPDIIATGCPFCNTMITDGVKAVNEGASTC